MKYGVILARFQPIHNGHLALIRKALSENEKLLLLVGSADKLNERNPIPIHMRIDMVKGALTNEELERCIIVPFSDLSTESDNSWDWGMYLYANVVEHINFHAFTMYYSDGYEIITQWFPGHMFRNHISLSLLARGTVESGISATAVREYIINNSDEKLKNVVPESVYNNKEIIKTFIDISKK